MSCEWEYLCTSCGNHVDQDHDYCRPCDQRGGEWYLIDEDGEEVDTNVYGAEAYPELIKALESFLERYEEVLNKPEMQVKVDRHGNEAARIMRAGVRGPQAHLKEVLFRAKKTGE